MLIGLNDGEEQQTQFLLSITRKSLEEEALELEKDYGVLPAEAPTWGLPGSAEKLAEMIARAERGEQIFHPDDHRRDVK